MFELSYIPSSEQHAIYYHSYGVQLVKLCLFQCATLFCCLVFNQNSSVASLYCLFADVVAATMYSAYYGLEKV